MILFWLICAGLAAIALAFVLPTLLQRTPAAANNDKQQANVDVYRDQLSELETDLANGIVSPEQYRQDRDEIERRLLEDTASATEAADKSAPPVTAARGAVYAVAFGVPVGAVALYLLVGNTAALSGVPAQRLPAANLQGDGQMSQQGIEANVAALAKRLEQNPGDADGWAMLGRSYINLEKYSDASNAYAKAVAVKTNNPDLLVEYAFALAMTNNRQLQGKPLELVNQALEIAPENPKALELAGSAAFQAKDYKQAVAYWQRVLEKAGPDTDLGKSISERIKEAKDLAATGAK
jgi:cytochrome c-type biogenesis protein CcmH